MNEFLQRLKQRKLVQWGIAYVAAAFALLQGIDIVGQQFGWPENVRRGITLALVVGFFVTLVIAWYHGERGAQRASGTELLIISLILALGGGFLWRFSPTRSSEDKILSVPNAHKTGLAVTAPEKSIAVLPFDNLSRDPDNAYFCEGVQDEILTRLAKAADLKVISRTSTQRFKSAPENLSEIAKQLGVAHILEGSVQKAADQVRVNVQLINAMTDAHLWADTFDRKLTDIFAVESEIATAIADQLQAKLTGSEKTMMAKRPTESSDAYELYLKGRFFWNKRTASDLRKSIDYFKQATALDPNYAQAYAAEGQAWVILPAYNGGAPKDCGPPAGAAIKKALALDETCADAYTALGNYRSVYDFNFADSESEYERAIELNPNDSTAHHWYGSDVLAALGDSEKEIAEMQRARELDPLSLAINTNLGVAFLHAGLWNKAISQLHKTLEINGSFYFARWELGVAFEGKGDFPAAMAEYQKAMALIDDPVAPAYAGHLNGKLGQKDEALRILGQLLKRSKSEYVDPYYLAIVHLGLGQQEEALSSLETSYEDRNGNNLEYIRIDPFLDPLRGDPRFEALAEKIVPAREFRKVTAK